MLSILFEVTKQKGKRFKGLALSGSVFSLRYVLIPSSNFGYLKLRAL